MLRRIALVFFLPAILLAEDELPQNPEEPLEIEPPLLIQEIPQSAAKQQSEPVANAVLDPAQIQTAIEKAKKSAAAGERLFRSGIIAKIEVENRALKVLRLEADLANARADLAKQDVESLQTRFDAGEIQSSQLESAKSALTAAVGEAAAAVAKRDKAEMDEALLNLQRQKKLLAVGSGRKADVNRAQEKVTTLQQQQH